MSTITLLERPEFRGKPVGWSQDLERILNLPYRKLDTEDPRAAEAWTAHLRRERTTPCDCVSRWGFCITKLKPVQGWALEEAMDVGGLLGQIAVGEGKTGLDILIAMAIPGVKVALLLVPSNLKAQLLTRDFPQWSAHFKVPNLAGGSTFEIGRPVLHVVSYHEFSLTKNTDLLKRISPDLIIADEVHNLANSESARGGRFLRLMVDNPTKLAGWSGTITKKSIKDYAHISAAALRDGSPLPLETFTVEEWSKLLDAGPYVVPTGSFARLLREGEDPTSAFMRRLTQTKGVIATSESKLGVSLSIAEKKATLPTKVADAIEGVAGTWTRPDGEELVEILQMYNVARQVASGFYYRWIFPRGEKISEIEAWLAARKMWNKELRTKLKHATEHMDSPALLTRAAIRWFRGYAYHVEGQPAYQIPPRTRSGPLPVWDAEFWPEWDRLHKTVEPQTEPVWIDDFLAADAAEWANASKKDDTHGIVWYEHDTFGKRVASLGKLKHYGGGTEASEQIIEEKGKRSIVASVKAHGTGKNLQYAFGRNLFANVMSDGAAWEQAIGRTHRTGQPRDEVTVEVYRHTLHVCEAFRTAYQRARYIQATTGSPQKLCYSTIGFNPYSTS